MTPKQTSDIRAAWPDLPSFAAWENTCTTVQLWTQIVGKIRLELLLPINHSWGCALYVTTCDDVADCRAGTFAIEFDFVDHALRITTSSGDLRSFPLSPMTVADFYHQTMQALRELGIDVRIYSRPVEMAEAIPFAKDTIHASYDADAVHRFWTALVTTSQVFTQFRARFIGKVSPVHVFWGHWTWR